MSDIWAGEVGHTKYFCPHCQGIWDVCDRQIYEAHMDAVYGYQPKQSGTVTEVDREGSTITVRTNPERN